MPQVHQAFRVIWADHGDDISGQYAGTGALKSGFTRTGKRTTMGLLDDGVKSVTRYYLNTFRDGHKQDAFDFATGAYRAAAGALHSRPTLICILRASVIYVSVYASSSWEEAGCVPQPDLLHTDVLDHMGCSHLGTWWTATIGMPTIWRLAATVQW